MMNVRISLTLSALATGLLGAQQPAYRFQVPAVSGETAPRPRSVLYFSQQNNNHHDPAAFLREVRRNFGERGLQFTTSTQIPDLNSANLAKFDGLFFFGNFNAFPAQNQTDIIDFATTGGGTIAMHVATYSFINFPRMRDLIGGAFRGHHSIREFTPQLIQSPDQYPPNFALSVGYPVFPPGESYLSDPDHPILDGLDTYTSFDEPYLHINMSTDITVLGYREDHGGSAEPYTWVRTEGAGRVFYHANGHDGRTWEKENFRELMIRGTEWAANGQNPELFANFGAPVVSEDGQVQYFAQLDTATGQSAALYSGGFQSTREGIAAPGDNEALAIEPFAEMGHALTPGGVIATTPRIAGPGVPGNARALLIGAQRYPHTVAFPGSSAEALEAGFVFSDGQEFPFRLSSTGSALFFAQIEDSAGQNQKAAWVVSDGASMTPLLLETDPFPDLADATVTSLNGEIFSYSEDGTAAVLAGDSASATERHLLVGTVGSLASWLTLPSDDAALPADSVLTDLQSLSPVGDGTLTLLGQLEGVAPTVIETDRDQIVASLDGSDNFTLLFQEGSLVGEERVVFPDGPVKVLHTPLRSLFGASVEDDPAILAVSPSRGPAILLRAGDRVFIEDVVWKIDSLVLGEMMASGSHLLVPAVLSLESDPATTVAALIHHNGIEARVILREGWTVPTADGPLEIATIAATTGANGTSALNESGRAAILVGATDGTRAIVTFDDLGDLDDDGVPDTVEVAFGGDPSLPNQRNPPGYPVIIKTDDSEVTLSYWHLVGGRSTLSYRAETSENLIAWEEVVGTFEADPDQTGVDSRYELRFLAIPIGGNSAFFRFRLE